MNIGVLLVMALGAQVTLGQRKNYDLLQNLLGISDLTSKIYHKFVSLKNPNDVFQAEDERLPNTATYDFIVVGSGSAGCVIANRLSEVPEWNVLLLEAGLVESPITAIPVIAPIFEFTDYNWRDLMEYQHDFAMGMVDRRLSWPRGKALGGTTVINYMIYTRGNPLDYERWAAEGNPGWSYEEVLPYFIKSENSTLRHANKYFHGTGGEWSVEDSYQSELVHAFVAAGGQLGHERVDYATPRQLGFSTVQANTIGGRRHTAASAFLTPIKRHRTNLRVVTSAFVTKILINPSTRRAYGVEYNHKGIRRHAYASKEVILSAGTFNSPQLLMLSGIGPREHLREMNIPTLSDLPVGQFLQDHITYVGLTFVINKNVSLSVQRALRSDSIKDWLENGEGPFTSLGGVEGIAYAKVVEKKLANYPDVEFIFVGGALNSDYGLASRRSMRIRDDVYDAIWKELDDVPTWTIFPMPLHPKSVGSLKLRSADPFERPKLYGNYLSDSGGDDVRTMIAAIRFIVELSQTPAFQKYGSRLHRKPVPGCEAYEYNSDPYWECAIRSLSITLHHQVGTCKMGPAGDTTAVVDNELKVYGVGGLRVADCSVIPFAIGAHTSAPSVMIGEKASDIIKATWGASISTPHN